MAGINQVTLVGRLTKDVELKKTQSGLSVVSYSIAVDRKYKQQDQPSADFINCVSWRQSADFLANYAHKGSIVGVVGSIQTRNYLDQNTGKKVYITEVITSEVSLYDPKQPQPQQQYQQQVPQYAQQPQQQYQQQAPAQQQYQQQYQQQPVQAPVTQQPTPNYSAPTQQPQTQQQQLDNMAGGSVMDITDENLPF